MTTLNPDLTGEAPLALIEHGGMTFLISGMPDRNSPRRYIEELLSVCTRKLINVTGHSYCTDLFNMVGIIVDELYIPDGSFPNPEIIEQWVQLVKEYFATAPGATLAVHDQSGLGRSAVLVAIALMELGMLPHEAITAIREVRKGAFNTMQVAEIEKYESKNRLKEKAKLFCGRWTSLSEPTPGTSSSSGN